MYWKRIQNGLEQIYKKHEVLDCSFEIGGWWCYGSFSLLLFAINTARFYTSTQSNSTARAGNTFRVFQIWIKIEKSNNGKKQES